MHKFIGYGNLNSILNILEDLIHTTYSRSQNLSKAPITRIRADATREAYLFCQQMLTNLEKFKKEPKISNEWQPIESAPKDCAFLGYQRDTSGNWVIAPMYYSGNAILMLAFHSDNSEHEMQPTHWMAIPNPPAPL